MNSPSDLLTSLPPDACLTLISFLSAVWQSLLWIGARFEIKIIKEIKANDPPHAD